ncbi:RNA polymerase sigma factor [Mucilaginibacter gotjawali]|uniref:ECF RNA polymerase sigma factor SigH n=2 Tax=Mucilaginibacter gotjawali TaxID=1550579 RepID=A0A125T286_9SPHI|nr:sigma-70 family RNA polymerase sigma factor [Mucilaginibacter gotjawali]MBB3057808.1 RNA polymerase sigma factor (sigma-70 family) [Mucilaginibacter gotjawali]BAU52610.1 ECF RNA polymerase sigma factor SigH [Mucilaginibacter gotjawali]
MSAEKNNTIIQAIGAYGKNLLGFIRRRVKNDADAEDILQDVWYQFSSVLNSEPIEQTGAWLYRVARNKIIDKHKKHTETLLDDMIVDDDEDEALDFKAILMTEATTPETQYLRNLFWEQLFIALDELPEEQRQVFIWQELDDIPFKEIAERTGEKIQTLVSRKRYAVLHLRQRLRQLYDEITEY